MNSTSSRKLTRSIKLQERKQKHTNSQSESSISHVNETNKKVVISISQQNTTRDSKPKKATYSAQHCGNPNFYNQSRNLQTDIPSDPVPRNNYQYDCQCGRFLSPPPSCPPENALWDLQFSRWWGWNWVRKRDEIMQKQNCPGNK